MRLSLFASAFCASIAGANVQSLIDQDFALGLMEGVLDGQGTDFALCLVDGILPPVQGGAQALVDLKKGFTSRNLSEIGEGFRKLAEAFHASRHSLVPKCSDAIGDGSHIKHVMEKYHNISAFFEHLEADVVDDKDDLIGKDLESLLQAIAKGDHSGAGQHLGMLLHRILVEPEFPHHHHLSSAEITSQLLGAVPSWMHQDFAMGFFEGFIDNQGTDFALCVVNGILPVMESGAHGAKNIKAGFKSRNLTLAVDGMKEAATAVQDFHGVGAKCKNAKGDVADAMAVLRSLSGPLDFMKHIAGNVRSERAALKEEVDEAMKAKKEEHYGDFGQHLGSFLHMVLVGPFSNKTLVIV